MAEHEYPGAEAPERPFVAREAHECKQRAEDESRPTGDRMAWAMLAVAAELHIIRKELRRSNPGRR
ncbi:hypothetical protein OIA45_39760 [Streptomyces chartreusis]|uniref:hypothetical protein n=1 Tax=Streptomyces chartreusis TaxID=1969 RepID=UPI003866FD73|nr:hypothetical protein OIA45_39760 [Streptomyces chartreusis]